MNFDHTAAMERALEEIEKLKQQLRSERVLAALSSDFSNFGLWEYDIAEDTFCSIKKFNGTYLDEPEYIPNFRENMTGRGKILAEDLPEFNRFCDSLAHADNEVFCVIRVVGEAPGIVKVRFEGKAVFNEDGEPYKIAGRTIALTDGSSGDAGHDPLTGLSSPELFRDILAQKRSGINRYNSGAFLSVGVDKFRDIEAEQGREYSDYIQKCVAGIIEDALNSERDSAVTRIRSGEFLIYVSFINASAPDKLARRILDKVNGFAFEKVPAAVSIGIARLRQGRKLEDVYNKAAMALGEAQKSGGNCFMHYSITMGQTSVQDNYGSMSSGGASRVYELIIGAFCSDNDRSAIMRDAFSVAGQIVGASNIYMYNLYDPEHPSYMIYDATGLALDECPGIVINCSPDDISAVFGKSDNVRIHAAEDKITGLSLKNGAVCAECRATRFNGKISGFFAIIFNSRFELTDSDIRIISALQGALEKMTNLLESSKRDEKVQQLKDTIISDHRMEGFSIVPETFVIDVVGDNAAEHYNMRSGDICYKKMYGRSNPCENCPALKLDESEEVLASSAFYNEKESRWLDVTASVSENDQGERRYVVSSTDITDCLGKIQMKDSLTGVLTFDSFTAEALRLSAAPGSGDSFIAVISFAEFRRINEKYGYETANSLLIAVAEIFGACLKPDELICRSTASRFIVMFKEDDSDEMFIRLSAILGSIHKQIFDRFKVAVYLVAGVCCADDEINVMGALDRAVTAKNTVSDRSFYNRNHIVFYDGILREQLRERRQIEATMVGALKNDEFKVFYQPKVSINSGRIVGAEALVRWIRPSGETVSPGKFIPIFEQNGFITDMDFAIYRSAFSDISNWIAQGIKVPLISLNVSRYHLSDEHFVNKLDMLIKEIGVPHKYIELEITETLLTENLETLVDTVTLLKEKGFRISVDDFGSGYSSLNLITQMPFDTLKIDGSFFLKNELTERNKKVISSIVTLAKSLNLETVSEGVETDNQVDFLKELGCDIIQGFFYYKPMPSGDFEKLLKNGINTDQN